MEIQQIRAFLAVAEELHFGRAAEKLFIAQPPLSRAIQNLERELGTLLFARSTRSVRLTPAGEALVRPARDILDGVRRAGIAVASAGKGETGRVRVAFAGASSHVMVGKLAKLVRETHPGIDFELYSSNFAIPALDKVINKEMEIGLGRWNFIPAGIEHRVIAYENLVIAIHSSHPLADRKSVSMADLVGEPFVTLPQDPGAILRDHLFRLASTAGFVPSIVQVAPDTWTLVSLVAAEIGIALTVSTVAENVYYPGVIFLPLEDDTEPILLQLVWRSDNDSPALREVLRLSERVLPTPAVAPGAAIHTE
ncbi:transcriptional regulator, LysR family [Cryobacterium psychrotolerans]|uniref:Transcriptional regulator, LysR family n=1 Tax=Cryobacterium psychrotolerans TaxID=386301 RepID=A0A1G8YJ47_9MICO|nr:MULTISPECIES: LysR substrate-binding domain-containing protein [Cryobacterium]TFD40891.1 LysR family transcriptional regulator [Cryobacterium sp. TMT1-2-1]TFD85310.1 LysR family transcriptional regulator [Cryobacterium psychrotolerans]SDK02464.1 transcriptional regulator, LysR family [Cryobacterium psychrotolerans]